MIKAKIDNKHKISWYGDRYETVNNRIPECSKQMQRST